MFDISILNENQKQAVTSDSRYIRIIAGAGSGKTRVLTMRIAWLIDEADVRPYKILAITFTNKAANEMRERIMNQLPDLPSRPFISTIHSLCVRILREDIAALGWPRSFTITDADDQKSILKEIYKKMDIDSKQFSYGSMIDFISSSKTEDISPEEAMKLANYKGDEIRARIYDAYVKKLESLRALDFDDLILKTVKMFAEYPDVLEKWQRRFEYILVDEFQDIDRLQYRLVRYLAGKNNSLLAVGDPDQTIYTWRGADVSLIMNFTKDFPGTETIILNENYRSTDMILDASNCVIRNNRHRVEKDLFTSRKSEDKVIHYKAETDEDEAAWIASKAYELHSRGKKYTDMAVLYRSNYLSRSLEKGMLDARIPYIIYGGIRFYERQEVKDAVCYLRMITSADDLALQRVLNRPRRGIGNKTMETIAQTAEDNGITMYEAIRDHQVFSGRTAATLKKFTDMVESWREAEKTMPMDQLFEKVLLESGYKAMLDEAKETDRIDNLKELEDDMIEFANTYPDSSLDEYLQLVSLYGEKEQVAQGDYITLMTVHAAKGLEFDTVFVSDLNDGIFPNERAMNEGSRGVEEERRLAYVAFTRAKNRLYLTEAGGFSFVLNKARTTSRFVNEIDQQYITHAGTVYENEKKKERILSSALFHDTERPMAERLLHTKASKLKKGQKVSHTVFGEGIVIRVNGGIAEIAFAYPHGVKKIAAGHPSIKIL
ncbi:MAG: UvrD-helicase domain-containing protein [Solobacterium sp.]|nr:UvrD-helicase domain-containing protein [Solobacterium sp.]